MKFKRGNNTRCGELSYEPFQLGAVVGTQERVSTAFVLDCHEMTECFLMRPPLCTHPVIESRIPLEYSKLATRVLLKLTAKKQV